MDDKDIAAVKELAETIDSLKIGAMIFIGILALIALAAFFIWLFFRSKAQANELAVRKLEQESKDRRANDFTDAMRSMGSAILAHEQHSVGMFERQHENFEASNKQTQDFLEKQSKRLEETIDGIHHTLQGIQDKQAGVLNRADSVRICETLFEHFIMHEFHSVAASSLEKNHWKSQKEIITEKVNQVLSGVMYRACRDLATYELAFDYRVYFVMQDGSYVPTSGASVESDFMLVQEVWEIIKKLHEERSASEDTETYLKEKRMKMTDLIAHTKRQITRAVRNAMNAGTSRANDIYADFPTSTRRSVRDSQG